MPRSSEENETSEPFPFWLVGTIILLMAFAGLLLVTGSAFPQTVSILPNAMNQFSDANGAPYASGRIYFYVPGTTTPKNTWQDSLATTLNTNPILLDSAGRAIIFGNGQYREVLQDSLGNVIWDQITAGLNPLSFSIAGNTAGTANAIALTDSQFTFADGQTIEFNATMTNTGDVTIAMNGTAALSLTKMTLIGPAVLTGGEVVAGTQYLATYSISSNTFQLVSFPIFSSFPTGTTQGTLVTKGNGNYEVSPQFDVVANGATGNGTTNDTLAIQTTFNVAGVGGGRIHFPCGKYLIQTTLQLSIPAGMEIALDGSGADCTVLFASGAINGLIATYGSAYSSISVRHMTFSTDQNGGGTAGLVLTSPASSTQIFGPTNTIEDVNFRGDNEYGVNTNWWGRGFAETGVSNINVVGGICKGPGNAQLGNCYSLAGTGTGAFPYSMGVNFEYNQMDNCGVGIFYGDWTQSVNVTNAMVNGCNIGVTTGNGSGDAKEILNVTSSTFFTLVCGVCIEDGNFSNAQVNSSTLTTGPGSEGITIQGTNFNISNNQFGDAGFGTSTAINLLPSFALGGVIADNTIGDFLNIVSTPDNAATQTTISGMKYTLPIGVGGAKEYLFGAGTSVTFIETQAQVFSKLPACTAGFVYSSALIADSTTATFGAVITGGGASIVTGLCDGTNWVVR